MYTLRGAHHEEIKNGHAHGDAVGDLLENSGARAIGDVGSDFGSAIDRPGMEDQRIGLGQFHAFGIELVKKDVIVLGERRLMEALGLNAKDDDDVGTFKGFLDAVDAANKRTRRTDVLEFAWHPHRRSAKCEAASELAEKMNVRARHAGMRDVAEDGDIQIVEGSLAIANGEGIEQTLRRVLVRAVPRVDHGDFQVAGDKIGGARRRMAHYKAIRLHRIEIVRSVEKSFTFLEAGSFSLKIHGVRAETRGGGAETQPRARGILEEGEGDGFTAKSGEFFERVALNFLKRFGLFENKCNFFCTEGFDREQITKAVVHICSRKKLRRISERGGVQRP